jgi:DMSO reductase family type II enzyme chaperone
MVCLLYLNPLIQYSITPQSNIGKEKIMTDQLCDSDIALCRSAVYEALALGFRVPTRETVHRLIDENQNQGLADIAAILDEGSEGLSSQVRKFRETSDVQVLETLTDAYRYYFGHTAHPEVPPYETEYGEETLFQQPQQLGDLAGFYNAFGLQLNSSEHERADHISCELEFLAFLARKEAYALQQGDQTMLEETRRAQKLFLKDHLARFVPAFANRLSRQNPDGFYAVLGKVCYQFVVMECDRFGISPGPEHLRFRPALQQNECFTCGGGEEVIREICQIQ